MNPRRRESVKYFRSYVSLKYNFMERPWGLKTQIKYEMNNYCGGGSGCFFIAGMGGRVLLPTHREDVQKQ